MTRSTTVSFVLYQSDSALEHRIVFTQGSLFHRPMIITGHLSTVLSMSRPFCFVTVGGLRPRQRLGFPRPRKSSEIEYPLFADYLYELLKDLRSLHQQVRAVLNTAPERSGTNTISTPVAPGTPHRSTVARGYRTELRKR